MNIDTIKSNISNHVFMNRGKVGFVNLGNTCYFNSILQCLIHSVYLPHFFLSNLYKKYLRNNDNTCLIHNLNNILSKYWLENNSTLNPIELLNSIRNEARLKGFDQFQTPNAEEDAHELVTFLIDCIHSKICKKVIITIEGKPMNNRDLMAIEANKSWISYFNKNYSAMITLFYGQFCSSILDDCGNVKSSNYDPFNTLELQVPTSISNCSLYDCLDEFTKKEKLEHYDSKNPKKLYYRRFYFWKTPQLLIICFKRFNNLSRKINHPISFPIYNLNISKYTMHYEEEVSMYNLYAICNHVGNSSSGHYYAYCRNESGNWYEYNDDSVQAIHESKLITQHAYCLFYKKI